MLAHIFMRADGQGPLRSLGALRLEGANGAIAAPRPVDQYAIAAVEGEPQVFAAGADEHVAFAIEGEVVAREDALGCAARSGM